MQQTTQTTNASAATTAQGYEAFIKAGGRGTYAAWAANEQAAMNRNHTITYRTRSGRKVTETRTLAAHRAQLDPLGKYESDRQKFAPTSFNAVDFQRQAEAAAILAIL